MTDYDPIEHWRREGVTYERDFPGGEVFEKQERVLVAALNDLSFQSVLDAGCGFGRITGLIDEHFGPIPITGIDISPEQIAGAKRRVPRARYYLSSILDFDPDEAWDLVIASEVLMHQPPDQVGACIDRLRYLATRYLVTVDWSPTDGKVGKVGNFAHPYRQMLGPVIDARRVGQQEILVSRP